MRLTPALSFALLAALVGPIAVAQQPDAGSAPPPPQSRMRSSGSMMGRGDRDGFRVGPPGMWWKNPDLAQKIGLAADQQKRMDDIFQKSRLELVDLKASLEKQELLLQPMLAENPPDTNKILAQIDLVAQARAQLEKGNARMLLGIRGVLTPDQWTKLQAAERENRGRMMRHYQGQDGRGERQAPGSTGSAPEPPPGL